MLHKTNNFLVLHSYTLPSQRLRYFNSLIWVYRYKCEITSSSPMGALKIFGFAHKKKLIWKKDQNTGNKTKDPDINTFTMRITLKVNYVNTPIKTQRL